jgi:hypothetical protein
MEETAGSNQQIINIKAIVISIIFQKTINEINSKEKLSSIEKYI